MEDKQPSGNDASQCLDEEYTNDHTEASVDATKGETDVEIKEKDKGSLPPLY